MKTVKAPTKSLVIAVSGIKGSFTEGAAQKFCNNNHIKGRLRYDITPDKVFNEVTNGKASLGIVPLYNSTGGVVLDTVKAMAKYVFEPHSLIEDNVEQNILVLPGKKKRDIKRIISHPQALSQSRIYLARNWPGVEKVEYDNTALAARDLAKGKLSPDSAVIASIKAADLFGLEILEPAVQDQRFNFTTFLVFSALNKKQTRP